jgi:hypothetical protein
MAEEKKEQRPKRDLDAEALMALEEARAMRPGPERTEAMKRAGCWHKFTNEQTAPENMIKLTPITT